MATYYVSSLLGNVGYNGLAPVWDGANGPKATLSQAEAIPVAANDTVKVQGGSLCVYRETLTLGVSGAAGQPITYEVDVLGQIAGWQDSVGMARITGSDNDQTAARAYTINGTTHSYRTFRGFAFDTCSGHLVMGGVDSRTNWIIEDCTFQQSINGAGCVTILGASQGDWIVRRCQMVMGYLSYGIYTSSAGNVDDTGHLIELCNFRGMGTGLYDVRIGGITVRNCLTLGITTGYRIVTALTVGQTVTINNCILFGETTGFIATVLGEMVENYNNVFSVNTPRTNVAVGANSTAYPPLFDLSIIHSGAGQVSGFRMPQPPFGALSTWSQVRAIADTGPATEDLFGMPRPVTAGKRSWGAVQFQNESRDTTTVRGGVASLRFTDAGRKQFFLPVTGLVQITVSVYVNREVNYAGTNPQMLIKQPGQADRTTTDAGAASGWNLLTDTFTPSATPGWVTVELVSNNTAAAGNYDTFFDDLAVTVSPSVGAMETWLWDTQVADWVSAAGGGVTRGRILYGVP